MMFNKLHKIHKTPNSDIIKKLKPLFEFKQKIKDGGLTREQKRDIKAVNKYYRNKLSRQSSFYSLGQWNKEFEKSQQFKKNICEFPCIDFHKTKRSWIEGGSIDSKKGFNSSISNNPGNYLMSIIKILIYYKIKKESKFYKIN